MNRQRGALTFIVPLIMVVIVLFGTLAIDGARLYSLRQEMQSVANTAATAAVNAVQACNGRLIDYDASMSDSALGTIATTAIAPQLEALGGELTLVQSGIVEPNEDGLYSYNAASLPYSSNAVRVVYEIKDTPISLLLPSKLGSLDMKVSAVAKKEVLATISAAGSTAIIGGTDEGAGLLGALIGGLLGVQNYTLDATDIESLAATTFDLRSFLQETGVADGLTAVDDVIGVDDFLRGVLAGLDRSSDAARTVQNVLQDSGLATTNIKLDKVIGLVANVPYPEETRVPVYDTVVALALNVASGVVRIPLDLDLDIAGLTQVDVDLLIDKPPTVAVGPARLGPDGEPLVTFEAPDIVIGLTVMSDLLGLATLEVPLLVDTGGGTGYLASASCAQGTKNDVNFGVWLEPEIARIRTGKITASGGTEQVPIKASLLPAFESVLVSFNVSANIEGLTIGNAQPKRVYFDEYQLHEGTAQSSTNDADLGIYVVMDQVSDVLEINTKTKSCGLLGLGCLLDTVLGPILNVIEGTLNEALSSSLLNIVGDVLNGILQPLLSALGLHLGGMTVSLTGANQGIVVLLDCSDDICEQL